MNSVWTRFAGRAECGRLPALFREEVEVHTPTDAGFQPSSSASPAAAVVDAPDAPPQPTDEETIETDLLIEDVSIDGMCGVY
jgi:mycofactocin precursor